MRYPGDNAAGRPPGRRHSPSGRTSPSEERPAAAGRNTPRGDASLFAPGYPGGQGQAHPAFPDDGGWYAPGGAAVKGPVHGFPPAPGQPPPLYPADQFSAWNRAPGPGGNGYDPSEGDAWLAVDYAGPAGDDDPEPEDAETGPGGTGYADRAVAGPDRRTVTGPSQCAAARANQRPAGPPADRASGGRGRGTRGRTRPRGRKRLVRTLLACALALAVVVGATYFWLARDQKSPGAAAASHQAAASARPSPTDPSPSPSPSLGPWGHIASRALDPVPLTLAELFPAQFSAGGTSYVMTVEKAKTRCATALMGSQLVTAVGHAGCTQAMRASYLSADHKLMGTIGVLNLVTVAAAEKAGKVAGPAEFIAQLPGAKGPTRNLTKGAGFEAAEVKGHYLVLVWAEFTNLRAPRSAAQRAELESFISLLFQQTANVSLASREVTGSPAT